MAPSNFSSVLFLFVTFVALFSSALAFSATSSSSSDLIQQACVGRRISINSKVCVNALESDPRTRSAKDFLSLAIGIFEAGIESTSNTKTYLQNLLGDPKLRAGDKETVKSCIDAYAAIVSSFKSALGEVKEGDYTATYDILLAGTDYVNQCVNALKSGNFYDDKTSKGNEFTIMYASAGYEAADKVTH